MWLIVFTFATYIGFFVAYGSQLPDFTFSCDDPLDCIGSIGGAFGAFLSILTLGGLASPLNPLVQGPLLLIMGLGWGPILLRLILRIIDAIPVI